MPGFDGFTNHRVTVQSECLVSQLEIFARKGGSGPGLLLLHGYPQTSHIWHKIAERLSEHYTVIASDLRGYGQSSKPPASNSHRGYSKREMAADQVQVMKHFGFDSFFLVGHDRGGRVAHRLALDHPEKVEKMMVLDIAPTLWMYEHTNMDFAKGYWHWFFLIQPAPGPEYLIGGAPEAFWATMSGHETHINVVWSESDLAEYKEWFFMPDTIVATCEDYRAAATIDLEDDRADLSAGRKLKIPAMKVLWGGMGMIEKIGGAVDVWKGYCGDGMEVTGEALDCGHYIPEERPEELLKEILEMMK